MERKIGEIFEFGGEWYQCVRGDICADCAFVKKHCNENPLFETIGSCSKFYRKDATSVIFKKLEKVGEPHFIEDEIFEGGKVYVQNFKVYKDFEGHKPICNDYIIYDWKNRIISIEIKQNKEDMEEEKHSNLEKTGKNLKPFDIQKAREGKPVCTRGGRSARIVCFDRKGYNMFPIVALIMNGDRENDIYTYRPNGTWYNSGNESDKDLMMLPEKHEGWVNIYRNEEGEYWSEQILFSTKKDATDFVHNHAQYVTTVKIEWEE